jgi:hypothetical protein
VQAAGADVAAPVDHRVPDLATGAARSPVQRAVQDETGTDALAEVDRGEGLLSASGAEQQVTEGLRPGLEVDVGGDAGGPGDLGADRQPVQRRRQAHPDDVPGRGVDHAPHGDPDSAQR